MWDGGPFSGTKMALICETSLIAYLRDDKPGIPFPGMWDLPGGGREGAESPIECALRELEEEFGLLLDPACIRQVRRYHNPARTGLDTYFCIAAAEASDIARIRFGDEGQHWRLMGIEEFISHPNAVPHLQQRLAEMLRQF
ncbi:NUDIX domain-containing protein [Hyphomonas sp.]|uniref:NUDIX domain-containing protein n=1 Tax=Hyphomonas sp. TaxID=87 RepID=UPI00391DAFAE